MKISGIARKPFAPYFKRSLAPKPEEVKEESISKITFIFKESEPVQASQKLRESRKYRSKKSLLALREVENRREVNKLPVDEHNDTSTELLLKQKRSKYSPFTPSPLSKRVDADSVEQTLIKNQVPTATEIHASHKKKIKVLEKVHLAFVPSPLEKMDAYEIFVAKMQYYISSINLYISNKPLSNELFIPIKAIHLCSNYVFYELHKNNVLVSKGISEISLVFYQLIDPLFKNIYSLIPANMPYLSYLFKQLKSFLRISIEKNTVNTDDVCYSLKEDFASFTKECQTIIGVMEEYKSNLINHYNFLLYNNVKVEMPMKSISMAHLVCVFSKILHENMVYNCYVTVSQVRYLSMFVEEFILTQSYREEDVRNAFMRLIGTIDIELIQDGNNSEEEDHSNEIKEDSDKENELATLVSETLTISDSMKNSAATTISPDPEELAASVSRLR